MNGTCAMVVVTGVVLAWNPVAGGLLVAIVVGYKVLKHRARTRSQATRATAVQATADTPGSRALELLATAIAGERLETLAARARADLGAPPARREATPATPPPPGKVTRYFQ